MGVYLTKWGTAKAKFVSDTGSPKPGTKWIFGLWGRWRAGLDKTLKAVEAAEAELTDPITKDSLVSFAKAVNAFIKAKKDYMATLKSAIEKEEAKVRADTKKQIKKLEDELKKAKSDPKKAKLLDKDLEQEKDVLKEGEDFESVKAKALKGLQTALNQLEEELRDVLESKTMTHKGAQEGMGILYGIVLEETLDFCQKALKACADVKKTPTPEFFKQRIILSRVIRDLTHPLAAVPALREKKYKLPSGDAHAWRKELDQWASDVSLPLDAPKAQVLKEVAKIEKILKTVTPWALKLPKK